MNSLPIKLIKVDKNNIDYNLLNRLSKNYNVRISIDGEEYNYHPDCDSETDCDCFKSYLGYEKE